MLACTEAEGYVLEQPRGLLAIARPHVLQRQLRACRQGQRVRRVTHRRLAGAQLLQPSGRFGAAAQALERPGQRRDRFERRHHQEGERCQEHACKRAALHRWDRDDHDCHDGKPGHQGSQSGRRAGCERVTSAGACQSSVGAPDSLDPLAGAAGDGQLRRSFDRFYELRREGRARGSLLTARSPRYGAGHDWHERGAREQRDEDHRRGCGQQQRRRARGRRDGERGDRRGCHGAHVEILQSVHVADEACEQVAASRPTEVARDQRRDPPEEARAQAPQKAQGGVVGRESLAVAQHGARDGESSHGCDRDCQLKDFRPLRGARDQVAGRDQQAARRDHGSEPEHHAEGQAAPLGRAGPARFEQAGGGGCHAASRSRGSEAGSSSTITWSACTMRAGE
jgi:hypothetical protein